MPIYMRSRLSTLGIFVVAFLLIGGLNLRLGLAQSCDNLGDRERLGPLCPPIDTVEALNCSADQIAKWDGTAWACAPDDDTLGGLTCPTGQVAEWNGTAWTCAADDDMLGGLTCATGQVAKWNGTTWACAADTDTDTDTLGDLTCVTGQVAKWNGTAWACAPDNDTSTLVCNNVSTPPAFIAPGTGPTHVLAPSCPTGFIMTGGGYSLNQAAGVEILVSAPAAQTWMCMVDNLGTLNVNFVCSVRCCTIQ